MFKLFYFNFEILFEQRTILTLVAFLILEVEIIISEHNNQLYVCLSSQTEETDTEDAGFSRYYYLIVIQKFNSIRFCSKCCLFIPE